MTQRIRKISPLAEIIRSQLEEINKYKWIESEKTGKDIGMERATREWRMSPMIATVRLEKSFLKWRIVYISSSPWVGWACRPSRSAKRLRKHVAVPRSHPA